MTRRRILLCLAALLATLHAPRALATNWNVQFVNQATLPAPASGVVLETSCVTYVGPAGSAHRFLAAQQDHGNIVQFDVNFTAAGGIASIANVVNIPIEQTNDFEGIAYTNAARNSVWMSEENGPRLREVSLATGKQLQVVTPPAVFANRRDNRGFESLTRSLDGTTMWTGNEEALTVDGPASTATAGTVVRLLKLNVNGNTVTPGPQFAYRVEPIHSTSNPSRSGLNDLTMMPDGTLLSLERSALDSPNRFFNRIFEINFAGATDVSVGSTASGLAGKSYTPVGKELLWSGSVGSAQGQNFEGLGLGPRLANGSWVLLGVIDSSSGGAGNTVVALNATANPSADFDLSGAVDGGDFLRWQTGLGTAVGAMFADGDADRDGDVDDADLEIWRAAQPKEMAIATPEPATVALAAGAFASLAWILRRRVRRPN
jgi:hypothetical protein